MTYFRINIEFWLIKKIYLLVKSFRNLTFIAIYILLIVEIKIKV